MQNFHFKKFAGFSQKRAEIIMMSFRDQPCTVPLLNYQRRTNLMIEKWFKQCLLLQITTALLITSLGPGFALWEMEKKLGKQGEPRESGASLGNRSARFVPRYFS